MRFTHEGKTYAIDFQRNHKQVHAGYDEVTKQDVYAPSKYPYTTVNVIDVTDIDKSVPWHERKPYITATVGAYHQERYSTARGRIHAMRLLTQSYQSTHSLYHKDTDSFTTKPDARRFLAAMWEAYNKRGEKA